MAKVEIVLEDTPHGSAEVKFVLSEPVHFPYNGESHAIKFAQEILSMMKTIDPKGFTSTLKTGNTTDAN